MSERKSERSKLEELQSKRDARGGWGGGWGGVRFASEAVPTPYLVKSSVSAGAFDDRV